LTPNVSVVGTPIKTGGWPMKAKTLEHAFLLAKTHGAYAFHYYEQADKHHGDLYVFSTCDGFEPRDAPRSCVSYVMKSTIKKEKVQAIFYGRHVGPGGNAQIPVTLPIGTLPDGRSVYQVHDDRCTKMVATDGEARYFKGYGQFSAQDWMEGKYGISSRGSYNIALIKIPVEEDPTDKGSKKAVKADDEEATLIKQGVSEHIVRGASEKRKQVEEELARLRKEVEELKNENGLLKKSLSLIMRYFQTPKESAKICECGYSCVTIQHTAIRCPYCAIPL
jgi:hypothetical protein